MMNKYDYMECMTVDIMRYITDYINLDEFDDLDDLIETLNDDLWIDDSITGNASGSYYCNASKAAEAIAGNMDLLVEAIEEFGDDPETYKRALQDPEYADVTIRCYLLNQAIYNAVELMDLETIFDNRLHNAV